MYVGYVEGEKHAPKNPEMSESIDTFSDCGYMLTEQDVIVDIDCLSKDTIRALISTFHLKTKTVWTDRGAHLYFKKSDYVYNRRLNGTCVLGFKIEVKKLPGCKSITVKRNGVARLVENENTLMDFPSLFYLGKKYDDLMGMNDGEGRNTAMFKLRARINGRQNWKEILQFVNQWIFADPLPDEEFESISRSGVQFANAENEEIATADEIRQKYKVVKYNDGLWWWNRSEYIQNDERLQRKFSPGTTKNSRFYKEVLEILKSTSTLIDQPDHGFIIRFKNGFVTDGQFIPIENDEFTPYAIDIEYDENAEPVKDVDDYLDKLTSGDEDYKKLLGEILGFTLITDPEKVRALGKFFIFRGDGANGKGTLLQIIRKILNDKNCTSLSVSEMKDERYAVTMKNKLANLGDDLEGSAIGDKEMKMLKNISTADSIALRELYKQSASSVMTTKLIFTTNHMIKSYEKGDAYQRRVLWLPMFTRVEKKDPNFITKLTRKEALKYWVRLMVEGYKRLYENGQFTDCEIVHKYTLEYHEENNPAIQCLQDIDVDENVIGHTVSYVMGYVNNWCEENQEKITKKQITETLRKVHRIEMKREYNPVSKATERVFKREEI